MSDDRKANRGANRQCRACPWKVGVNPNDIPNGYDEAKHRALINTIADPEMPNISRPLRVMACHETPLGRERPCVGWLNNQLYEGNNIALRLAVRDGRIRGDFELDGPQHARFEDTLPGKKKR